MFESFPSAFKKHKDKIIFLGIALIFLNFFVWRMIFTAAIEKGSLKIYFFDVGQGDSALVVLPGGVKVLIDGGAANGKVLEGLAKILSPLDRYIDLVMMSHSQWDHFGGLIDVLKRYRVGAFLWSGRRGKIKAFESLENVLTANDTKAIVLAAGDKIHYRSSRFEIFSPPPEFLLSKDLNDTSIVAELASNNSKTLFTGDIGFAVEERLLTQDLLSAIDVLKVPHHGSKYSSSPDFLAKIKPKIAVISVGKNNYGHPTTQTLGRLKDIGSIIYRTDLDGTIKIVIDGKKIRVFTKF
jgi:competence protein ComEC